MSTQTITVELPAGTYRILRRMVEAGDYATESEAIAEALLTLSLEPAPEPGSSEYDRWMRQEVLPAFDEMVAHPDSVFAGEEVLAYLEEQRHAREDEQTPMRKVG